MKKLTSIALSLVAAVARAQGDEAKLSDEPTFRQIFNRSVEDAASLESSRRRDALTAEVSLALVTPSELTLKNKYFEVPYSDTLTGAQLGFAFGLASSGRLQLGGTFTTGYGYAQFVGEATSLKTGLASTDAIKIQRVPLMLGVRGVYDAGPVAVFVEPAMGMQWLNQSGYLDGMSQSFWVTTASLSGGIVLFDQTGRSNSWFGGVRLAGGLDRGLGSDQKVDLRHIELGLRARL